MKYALIASVLAISAAFAAPVAAQTGDVQMSDADNEIVLAQSSAGFERWRSGFRSKALANGIEPTVFDAAFRGVEINRRVIELDGRQAEFVKPIWEYLDSTVSTTRVNNGRQKARGLSETLASIERYYGVDAPTVMAIWGIETNYGGFMGGTNVIEALATLAYDGRRRAWAERELILALSIIQSGDVRPQDMEGSWAGAMGHTQFMPSSYIAYAQDFTNNGRRDIWSNDPTDGLASTANYLRVHGWKKGQPWGIEVNLPQGFDYSLATFDKRPINYWNGKGVRQTDGKAVPNYGNAALWLPAGALGPSFLLFNNFFVIKRYNNANSYALAVGHLGDRIYGGSGFQASWPRDDRALSRSETRQLQTRLTQRGFNTQGADGIVGPNTVRAIRSYQRSLGLTPDGYASFELLKRLQ